MKNVKKNYTGGFTLIEVLLVIAILAILAAVVIVAINPAKQFGESQNAQRRSDVRAILDATHQYSLDNSGALPSEDIPQGSDCYSEGVYICRENISCDGAMFDPLILNQKYLASIPIDPTEDNDQLAGYMVVQSENGRITVCAPATYGGGAMISVTR